jgi:hypothetical protein
MTNEMHGEKSDINNRLHETIFTFSPHDSYNLQAYEGKLQFDEKTP